MMIVDLDTIDLQSLVKGAQVRYEDFDHLLVKKAGHSYSDQYGRTSWRNLSKLSDLELYALYLICKRIHNNG